MIAIQIFLIFIAVFVILMTLRGRSTHSVRAWKKLALVALAVLMIIAVILPERTNDLARLMGVGRGADLLLYLTVTSFIVYVLNEYLAKQDQRDKLNRLGRALALFDANKRYDMDSQKNETQTAEK